MPEGPLQREVPPEAPLQPDPADIASEHRAATGSDGPGLIFCGGFHSSMAGDKALHLEQLATDRGLAFTRFDYRGHGRSGGDARSLGVGHWLADTLSVIDATEGPLLLIGSSMGGWLSVLASERRPQRVVGLLTIAAAPDFITELLPHSMEPAELDAAAAGQLAWRDSEYSDTPWPIPPVLLESGVSHRVLHDTDRIDVEATLIHGTADINVPIALSYSLRAQRLPTDTPLVEVAGGDHRLSDTGSLHIIETELDRLLQRIG